MPLFDQEIEIGEDREGFRLNVVSFTGNPDLSRATRSVVSEFEEATMVFEETDGTPDVLLAKFSALDQHAARAVATVVRDAGFRSGGICYAAVRHDAGPGHAVDYIIAFE